MRTVLSSVFNTDDRTQCLKYAKESSLLLSYTATPILNFILRKGVIKLHSIALNLSSCHLSLLSN